MHDNRSLRRWLLIGVVTLGVAWLEPPVARAAAPFAPLPPHDLLHKAAQAEARGDWLQACDLYEQLPVRTRTRPDVRQRYHYCLRRLEQERRHRDSSFQQRVLPLSLTQALDTYGEVLANLQSWYVERDKASLAVLHRQGVEELYAALDDPTFCRRYLPDAAPAAVRAFQARLRPEWGDRPLRRLQDAQAAARDLARAAQDAVGVRPTVVVLELLCGACNALDEYTAYVTPGTLDDVHASLRGELVGIGITVAGEKQQVVVTQVLPGSPADGRIKPGERLLRVGDLATAGLPAEVVAEQLKGAAGSLVRLEVAAPGAAPRVVALERRPVRLTSVSPPRFLGGPLVLGIGYVQIHGFHETTPQEFDDAILELQQTGLKVLVLDLRGNPGGLFTAALQVAERFFSSGVIVSTQGTVRSYNKIHEAQTLNPLTVPLVVLVDSDTASAAEMVAGAFKERGRATLVGQPTFGKGTIQRVRRLTTAAGGLRITVARFYSPSGQAYDGTGVTPHLLIERTALEVTMDPEQDSQVQAALQVARELLMPR